MSVNHVANRKSKEASSFFWIVVTFGVIAAGLALTGGIWLTRQQPQDSPLPKGSNQEVSATPMRPLTSLAMLESVQAREIRALVQPEARIARFYKYAPVAGPDDVRQLLQVAADDPSRAVRIEALNSLGLSADTRFREELLLQMIQDSDEAVRDLAFHRVNDLEVADRVRIFAKGLDSSNDGAVNAAVEYLAGLGTRAAVESLLERTASRAGSKQETQLLNAAARIIGRSFGSTAEAKNWWDQHKAQFTEEMSRIPAR